MAYFIWESGIRLNFQNWYKAELSRLGLNLKISMTGILFVLRGVRGTGPPWNYASATADWEEEDFSYLIFYMLKFMPSMEFI